MEDKKKRIPNFSNNERNVLSELVMKYQKVIENKQTDASTNAQKTAGWIRLAEEFNSVSIESYRTPNNLKTCWENIKRATKKQVSFRKKNIFMTGLWYNRSEQSKTMTLQSCKLCSSINQHPLFELMSGGKPPAPPGNDLVEAVLGPSLEGLPNNFDCDGPNYNEIETVEPIEVYVMSPVKTVNEEEEKENKSQDDFDKASSCKNASSSKELWKTWSPASLKRPLAGPLQHKSGDGWMKRRRPNRECSADALLREKIDLVKILTKNAEEEGKLRIAILKEQLEQERIKTRQLQNK